MITDEAVEAAARVLCRKAHIDKYGTDAWRDGELDTRLDQYWPCWSTEARAALEAALPHLLASQGCGTGHSGEQLEPAVGATAALAPVPCGGCGATENSKRCMGCLHDFGTPDSAWVHRYAAHPQKGGEG